MSAPEDQMNWQEATGNNPFYLVYILHGYTMKRSAYEKIKRLIQSRLPNAKVEVPSLPLSTFSVRDPNAIVNTVLQNIDRDWNIAVREHLTVKVILIGHSTGALLAKKVYICACGETSDIPFEDEIAYKNERPWSTAVDRIILLAGMNRGWSLNPHLYTKTNLAIRLGIGIGFLMSLTGREPVGLATRRGAPFVTMLRM